MKFRIFTLFFTLFALASFFNGNIYATKGIEVDCDVARCNCQGWSKIGGICCPTGAPDSCSKLGTYTCVKDPYVSECKLVAPNCPKGKQYAYQAIKWYTTTEELMKDPRCSKPTSPPQSTITPTPTATPTPTPTKSPSPKPTPTKSPTASPVPLSKLIICKYKDENGNGVKDASDKALSWKFRYETPDFLKEVENKWWNVIDRGCVKVDVASNIEIKVSEIQKNGWELTGIYADDVKQSGGNYIYKSEPGKTKKVWFLNKQNVEATPTIGEPNSCNGTCGSNTNCKSGLFCYEGYCRIPENPKSAVCATPAVLGATAKPVTELPKTGNNILVNLLGLLTLGGSGLFIYRKFKLI